MDKNKSLFLSVSALYLTALAGISDSVLKAGEAMVLLRFLHKAFVCELRVSADTLAVDAPPPTLL